MVKLHCSISLIRVQVSSCVCSKSLTIPLQTGYTYFLTNSNANGKIQPQGPSSIRMRFYSAHPGLCVINRSPLTKGRGPVIRIFHSRIRTQIVQPPSLIDFFSLSSFQFGLLELPVSFASLSTNQAKLYLSLLSSAVAAFSFLVHLRASSPGIPTYPAKE